jgi:hypothetical protein
MADCKPKLSKKIAKKLNEGMHPQVVLDAEITSKLSITMRRPRLEYLQLALQKPKALPSFEPLIDDEFLFTDRELKLKSKDQEETPKQIKRKIKEQEKHAAKELRKDTQVLMSEKKNQSMQRTKSYKKSIYSGGNRPTDEI